MATTAPLGQPTHHVSHGSADDDPQERPGVPGRLERRLQQRQLLLQADRRRADLRQLLGHLAHSESRRAPGRPRVWSPCRRHAVGTDQRRAERGRAHRLRADGRGR
eukprot:7653050-Pyramimonas_sp.AAC.1